MGQWLHHCADHPYAYAVLIHALAMAGSTLSDVIGIVPHDVCAVAVDCRAHRLSDAETQGFAPTQFANDIVAVLDAVGRDRAVIAEWSIGGCWTRALASDYPDRTAGLVLIDTLAWGGPDVRATWTAWAATDVTTGLKILLPLQRDRLSSEAFCVARPDRVADIETVSQRSVSLCKQRRHAGPRGPARGVDRAACRRSGAGRSCNESRLGCRVAYPEDARPITLFEQSTATAQPSLRPQAQWRRPGHDHHDQYLRLSGRTDDSRGAGTSPKQGGQEWSVVVLLLGRSRVILVDTASLSVQRTVLARLGQQRIGRGDMTETLRTHARYDHMMNGAMFTFATVAIGGAEKDPVLAAPSKTSLCTTVYV